MGQNHDKWLIYEAQSMDIAHSNYVVPLIGQGCRCSIINNVGDVAQQRLQGCHTMQVVFQRVLAPRRVDSRARHKQEDAHPCNDGLYMRHKGSRAQHRLPQHYCILLERQHKIAPVVLHLKGDLEVGIRCGDTLS